MAQVLLTEDQQKAIEDYIIQSGLEYQTLMTELLDHLCCEVESKMESGESFSSSWSQIQALILPSTLKNIEHKTLIEINQNLNNMKKIMLATGALSAISLLFGAFFKSMHWPGANIFLVVGSLILAFIFLPAYFYYLYAQQDEKKNKVLFIFAFLAPFLIVLGFLFKTMHWPYGTMIALIGLLTLLIGFIPLFLYKSLKTSTDRAGSLALVLILIISVPILYFGVNPRMSSATYDAMELMAQRGQKLAQLYGRKNSEGYLMLHTLKGKSEEAEQLSKVSDEFYSMLESVRVRLQRIVEANTSNNFQGLKTSSSMLSYYSLYDELFTDEEKKHLMLKNKEFFDVIHSLNYSLSSGFKSKDYFSEITGGGVSWVATLEEERPALFLLTYLSELQTAIRATESAAINQLILEHQLQNHPKATEAGL